MATGRGAGVTSTGGALVGAGVAGIGVGEVGCAAGLGCAGCGDRIGLGNAACGREGRRRNQNAMPHPRTISRINQRFHGRRGTGRPFLGKDFRGMAEVRRR